MLVTALRRGLLSLSCVAVGAVACCFNVAVSVIFCQSERKSREINALTFSTMKRKVQSLKSELRALRTGHLSTSEGRLQWTLEEKHRHKVNGHAEYEMKSSGISRHSRRVYSESCAFDYASVTFKVSDGYATVLTGRGPRCECFCRVVPRKGQRLTELVHFLAVI